MSLASPWSQIVRGGESEAVPASPSSSASPSPAAAAPESSGRSPRKVEAAAPEAALADGSDAGGSNAARVKKPAWSNKPSNGVAGEAAGPVMGAVLWPALSESARVSPKSSSDSLKGLAEGSAANTTQGQVISSSPQKPIANNVNPNPNSNVVRQKSMKRGGSGAANNGVIISPSPSQPVAPPPPPPSVNVMPQHTSEKTAAAIPESLRRDLGNNNNNNNNSNNNGESGSKESLIPNNGNNHPRNSYRRGNGGGSYHNNYGNRRDHDRPNHEWNHQRRDSRMHQQRFAHRSFPRPPPVAPVFVGPPPIRAYANPVGYPEMPSPYFFVPPPPPLPGGVPYPHTVPPVVYYPPQDPQLHSKLVKQIDYYFSPDNLCRDIYLRQNMDEHGWVPISLIAGFNRVKLLTKDTQFVLAALHASSVVEVNGDKVRRQNDWMNWLLPTNQLASGMQSLGLEGSSSGEAKHD